MRRTPLNVAGKADTVGYGRPPTHSQFKPGQSGNPKGRTKRTPDVTDIVLEELNTIQTVENGGNRARISVLRLMIKGYIRAAAKGDTRALLTVLGFYGEATKRNARIAKVAVDRRLTLDDLRKMTNEEITQLYRDKIKETKE